MKKCKQMHIERPKKNEVMVVVLTHKKVTLFAADISIMNNDRKTLTQAFEHAVDKLDTALKTGINAPPTYVM